MQLRFGDRRTLTPDEAIDREVHPTRTWRAALCSLLVCQTPAWLLCSLILVLRPPPGGGRRPITLVGSSQPRPPGDNLADARSTLLRHDAADRQHRRHKRVEDGVRDNVGRRHGQDDAVPRMPLCTRTVAAAIG